MVIMARIAAMGMRASAEASSEASSGEDSEILARYWLGLCEMKAR